MWTIGHPLVQFYTKERQIFRNGRSITKAYHLTLSIKSYSMGATKDYEIGIDRLGHNLVIKREHNYLFREPLSFGCWGNWLLMQHRVKLSDVSTISSESSSNSSQQPLKKPS
jgi:hypothetical protein